MEVQLWPKAHVEVTLIYHQSFFLDLACNLDLHQAKVIEVSFVQLYQSHGEGGGFVEN